MQGGYNQQLAGGSGAGGHGAGVAILTKIPTPQPVQFVRKYRTNRQSSPLLTPPEPKLSAAVPQN